MPALAFLLRKFFLELVAFFAAKFGARTAVALGAVSAITIITGGFVLALRALVATVSMVWPSGIGFILGFLPPTIQTYIGIYFSARVIAWVYVSNVQAIQLSLKF